MLKLVNYLILIISLIIVVLVLIQSKGSGLSQVFGGEGGAFQTRRGLEKGLFIFTVILSIVFVGLSISAIFLQR